MENPTSYLQNLTAALNNGNSVLEEKLFPKISRRDSLYIVVPVTIVYLSIFVTGIVGNISTCIVIARNKSMHTATNYYLFSLAVSDLLLLASGLPAEIYLVWCKYPYVFGEVFCIIRGLAAETSTNASVLTITAFTVERYLAICHPFLSQTMSKLTRAVKLILVIWLVALSYALPQALQFGLIQHQANPDMLMCTVKKVLIQHSFELSTFLFFVIPMSLITVLYVLIGLKLRKSNMMKKSSGKGNAGSCKHHPGRSSRRVLKMLVAVVIAFFICWAPFHVQRLIAIYGTNAEDHISSNSKLAEFLYLLFTYISGVLYYVSTSINPILYNIMSNKFRVAFMETLSRSCGIAGLTIFKEPRSYSSLSRSQQRPIATGSRIAASAGTGIVHESSDCSGNSVQRDNSPKQSTSLIEHLNVVDSTRVNEEKVARGKEKNIDQKSGAEVVSKKEARSKGSKKPRRQPKRYAAVTISSNGGQQPGKKWWRLLKWFPGFKSLKLTGRDAYTVPERAQVRREEISMTMWNETNEQQHPV
ncbi:hypothetical protein QLX08_010722 [Tetragonisca angustula]|uniref:G-protein coupled receptors family 1 profile domain-containing protein n=1 Tax=Tetragonisca angustula TaxID=166442 RepID=A0AAW0ZB99_9HYME